MIIGLVLLFSRNNRSVGAVLLLVGGVFFLLGQLHVPLSGRDIFWPVVMIAGGLVMLIRMSGQARYHGQEALAPGDYIDELSILGSNHKVITSQNFRGGRILSLMGGTKLDLRQAKLAPGTNVLEVVTLFRGQADRTPRMGSATGGDLHPGWVHRQQAARPAYPQRAGESTGPQRRRHPGGGRDQRITRDHGSSFFRQQAAFYPLLHCMGDGHRSADIPAE